MAIDASGYKREACTQMLLRCLEQTLSATPGDYELAYTVDGQTGAFPKMI